MALVVHPDANLQLRRIRQDLPHAVVLVGSVGIGKSRLARIVAYEILGSSKIALENNPYYRELTPAKGTIPIQQVRELVQFFNLSVPGTARIKRIALIVDADTMGIEAQNALLKLLEEPPQGSMLILTSSRLLGLLPTIRSRVQPIMLADPSADAITAHFMELGFVVDDIRKAALRHGSNMAAIQATLADDVTTTSDDAIEIAKQILQGSQYDRLVLVDGLAKQKERAYALVEALAAIAAASLHTAAHKNASSLARWQSVLGAADRAQEALDKNGNTKLVLTELMLSL